MTQISSIFNANGLIAKIAKKEGFEGEPPTLTDIQDMAIATPEPMSDVAIASTGADLQGYHPKGNDSRQPCSRHRRDSSRPFHRRNKVAIKND